MIIIKNYIRRNKQLYLWCTTGKEIQFYFWKTQEDYNPIEEK